LCGLGGVGQVGNHQCPVTGHDELAAAGRAYPRVGPIAGEGEIADGAALHVDRASHDQRLVHPRSVPNDHHGAAPLPAVISRRTTTDSTSGGRSLSTTTHCTA